MMLAYLVFAPLVGAHFVINYPGSRGLDEDKHDKWPCGGFDTPSANRSTFPLTGGPLQILSTHTRSQLQVIMAVGNDHSASFNVVVVPTFQETGPNNFCFGDVAIPPRLNLTEGTNATLQVISGDSEGALYACVDVTMTSAPFPSEQWRQHCTNSSGVSVAALQNAINANQSTSADLTVASSSAAAGTRTTTVSGSAVPATRTSSAGGAHATMTGWILGALGVIGSLAAL